MLGSWTVLSGGPWNYWKGPPSRKGEAKGLDEIPGPIVTSRNGRAHARPREPLAEPSGLCLGRREEQTHRSWDWVQQPENTSNQLSLPFSSDGREIKNHSKLSITCVFHSQRVAVKIFFCWLLLLEMALYHDMFVMWLNNASCFIPRWGSLLSM